ncbi:MAG: hypothetical protein ABEJ73_06630 [Haloplanus sp.]
MSAPFVGLCSDCEVRVPTDDPNEVVRFYRRHHGTTGHDITWEQVPVDLEAPTDADLDAVVAALAGESGGVPLGTVSAAMNDRGWTVGETLDTVHDRRLTGALWEPRDDHIDAV